MGLLDIAAKVLTTYQADTSDMKAKLKELTGEEKALAQAQLAAAEARNKQSDDWVDKLAKVGLAFDTVARGVKFAMEGLKDYGHRLDLESTAGTVSIERLSKSAGGLKTNMELLEHAAVFNTSAFKLTEEQMGTVERAMWALEERGKDSKQVWDAVSTALTKGATKSLEGLIGPIQKTSDAFDINGDVLMTYGGKAKAVDAILKQMARTSSEVKDGQYDAADAISVTSVRISNAMEDMKQSLGKMVIALSPLIELVAKLAEVAAPLVDKIAKGWSDIVDLTQNDFIEEKIAQRNGTKFKSAADKISERHGIDNRAGWQGGKGSLGQAEDLFANFALAGGDVGQLFVSRTLEQMREAQKYDVGAALKNFSKELIARGESRIRDIHDTMVGVDWIAIQERQHKQLQEAQAEVSKAKEISEERRKYTNEVEKKLTDELVKQLESEFEQARSDASSTSTSAALRAGQRAIGGQPDVGALLDKFNKGELQKRLKESYNAFNAEKNQTFLAKTFGELDEFNLYKGAFQGLSSAVVAGFGAVIDGSGGVADAMKKALASSMKAEALNMALQAIKSTAMGVFSLASGDVPHAIGYFTSAGEFAAAGTAFGIGAALLGGGGGGGSVPTPGGARASAPSIGGGSAAATQPTGGIVVIGDSFAEDTARMRQLRAQRLVALAIGGNNAVVYG